jgi:glutathione synthase/RimK-type ligase-like ATP-grasp enzyme
MIKLGIVMDPIANINIKKDSSFAMLLEAQRRGYELHSGCAAFYSICAGSDGQRE